MKIIKNTLLYLLLFLAVLALLWVEYYYFTTKKREDRLERLLQRNIVFIEKAMNFKSLYEIDINSSYEIVEIEDMKYAHDFEGEYGAVAILNKELLITSQRKIIIAINPNMNGYATRMDIDQYFHQNESGGIRGILDLISSNNKKKLVSKSIKHINFENAKYYVVYEDYSSKINYIWFCDKNKKIIDCIMCIDQSYLM